MFDATFSSDVAPDTGPGFSGFFSGAVSSIAVPDAFDYGSAMTIEAWVKPASLGGLRVLWDDYGSPGVLFALSGSTLQLSLSTAANPGPGISVVGGTLVPNVWQHVAAVYDGAAMRLYVNGVAAGPSVATSGSIIDNSSFAAAIGADNSNTALFSYVGLIDDFRIFNAALTPVDLNGVVLSGTSTTVPPVPEPGTYVLLFAGLAMVAMRVRRKAWATNCHGPCLYRAAR